MTIRTSIFLVTALTCVSSLPARGQYPVDSRNRGERIIVVVPIVGSGALGDSKRPLLVPRPEEMRTSGIQSFTFELSDDGNSAIVEIVARDRAALDKIARDIRVIKAFEKGKDKRDDIERELRRHKKDYALGAGISPGAVRPGGAQ